MLISCADNGATVSHTESNISTVGGYARGWFSLGAPDGGFQSKAANPCQRAGPITRPGHCFCLCGNYT